jgi:hypothetical protein
MKIYPSPEESREVAERYIEKNYLNFYLGIGLFRLYYARNIEPTVSIDIFRYNVYAYSLTFFKKKYNYKLIRKLRSKRGVMYFDIKSSILKILEVPNIDINSKPAEIIEWKNSAPVKRAYASLFVENRDEVSNIKKIINGVDNMSIVQQAWAAAVVEILLNSEYDTIKINEVTVTPIFNKYLVSTYFIILFY